ncbi:MAG: ABC transporter ATP-binding protein [Bacteroidales bacterium]|nr:ABC transporter ATP-binding protein [Bacteroidales bacterium]
MIEIQNMSFAYKRKTVFDNISLRLETGGIYGLLGENGVGKTTMLRLVSGLLRPQAGTCIVDGMLSADRHPDLLQRIAFLPDAVSIPESATPRRYMLDLEPFYPRASYEEFQRLMGELQVEPDRKFSEMSFGQQKKSLIACILALGTEYILLDEPTNGLDIPSKADFRRILAARSGKESTIVISTHQVKDVENLINPVIIITAGEVLLNATTDEVARRLFFEYGGPQRPEALYSEMQPAGCLNVLENITGEESQVNIEALFNAVLRNGARVREMFSK